MRAIKRRDSAIWPLGSLHAFRQSRIEINIQARQEGRPEPKRMERRLELLPARGGDEVVPDLVEPAELGLHELHEALGWSI